MEFRYLAITRNADWVARGLLALNRTSLATLCGQLLTRQVHDH